MKNLFLAAFACTVLCTTGTYAKSPLPPNLTFATSAKAKAAQKQFLGTWRGDWTDELEGALAVTKIQSNGTAEVYYSWKFKNGSNAGYDGPLKAKIKKGVMKLPKFQNGAKATYYFVNGALEGHYKNAQGRVTVGTFKKSKR